MTRIDIYLKVNRYWYVQFQVAKLAILYYVVSTNLIYRADSMHASCAWMAEIKLTQHNPSDVTSDESKHALNLNLFEIYALHLKLIACYTIYPSDITVFNVDVYIFFYSDTHPHNKSSGIITQLHTSVSKLQIVKVRYICVIMVMAEYYYRVGNSARIHSEDPPEQSYEIPSRFS